jgi:hypothetical protein
MSGPVKLVLGQLFEVQAITWILKFSGDFYRFAKITVYIACIYVCMYLYMYWLYMYVYALRALGPLGIIYDAATYVPRTFLLHLSMYETIFLKYASFAVATFVVAIYVFYNITKRL